MDGGVIGDSRYHKLGKVARSVGVKIVRPCGLKPHHRDKRGPPPPQGADWLLSCGSLLSSGTQQSRTQSGDNDRQETLHCDNKKSSPLGEEVSMLWHGWRGYRRQPIPQVGESCPFHRCENRSALRPQTPPPRQARSPAPTGGVLPVIANLSLLANSQRPLPRKKNGVPFRHPIFDFL